MVYQVLSGLGYTTHRIKCESYRVSIMKVVRVPLVFLMCAMVGKSGGIYVSVGSLDGACMYLTLLFFNSLFREPKDGAKR